MADLKITGLDALAEASIQATDALAIADLSATETKKVTVKDLIAAGVALIDSGDIPALKVATPFAANSVATATIQDDAVTAAKLATDSVTTDAVVANAIGASELADNAVDSGALATNSVITSKITDANVTADKLANNAVTTVKILDANVTYAKLNLSNGDIPGAKITGNSITNAQIGVDAVGSSELANNAVDTASIADSAVTNAKLANASISLGGISISLGATDATPSFNLTDATNYPAASLSGTISNAQLTGSITGDKLANTTVTYAKLNISDGDIAGAKITGNSITAAQIAANAVTASELADNAVDTAAVADAAITSVKIASNTIVAGNLAANSVGASELADNSVDTAAVVNGAITADKIADGAITTAKLDGTLSISSLADNSITGAKIAANAVGASELADNAVDTAAISASAVTDAKVASGISGTKLGDGTITAAKLNTSNIDRSLNVASGNLGINNSISAATRSGITYNAQGLITATAALVAGDLPVATSSAVGGVSVGTGLSVNGSGALSLTNSLTAATVSGITFNAQGMITAATALTSAHLPIATTSAKGAVQITSGGGLSVDGSGNLITATSGISAGTYQSITVNNKGVATAGAALTEGLIPSLPASKITSGTLDAARIGADTIDSSKLSNSSTTIIQSITQLGYPTAAFTGQLLFDPIAEDAYLWDGNAWNPITTLTKGALVRLGTYNASTSKVDYVTSAGAAAGLTVGQNLPVASDSVDGGYVVISVQGTPSGIAGITGQLSPPDYLLGVTASSTSSSWVEIDLSTTVASQQASAITYTPYGQLSATNVQAVINEIEDEKLSLAGGTITGQVLIGNAGSFVFEGATADAFETTLTVADPTTSDKTITLPNVTGTVITTGDTGTVTGAMLANDTIQNVDIKSDAAIAFSKLAALTSAQILVGNGSNVATGVAVTGDISINNAGLTAIATGVIVNSDISGSAAITGSKVTTGTTSAVGVLQLTDSTSSTSATTAATPNAVKSAFDLATTANTAASAALPKAGGTMTGNLILDNAKELRLSEADSDGAHFTGFKAQAQSADIVLTLPATAPTTGQVLKSGSTATTLEWAADSSTDSTKLPLSGGTLTGNLILNAQSDVRFADADSSNYVGLQSPSTVGTSFTLTLPAADGSSGQALISDGGGNLSFSTVTTAAAGSNTQVQFNNSGSFAGSSSLTYNSGTGALTATSFVGNVSGNLTGNVTGNTSGSAGSCTGNAATATALASSVNIGGVAFDGTSSISLPGVNASGSQDTSGTAALATQLTVTANNSTDETVYPLFVDGASGSQGAETDTGLSYNPSSGLLTSTGFSGAGTSLTALNASNLSSGTVNVARLGSGSSVTTKFLRGDNTWQTISSTPEGTAILSTGESGGTKFLREDGDGTCSWQSVPAGVGGANQLQLNDSVKIKLGTGSEYEIYNDSANLIIDQTADSLSTLIRGKQNGNVTFDASDNGNQVAAKFKWSNDSVPVSSAELYQGGTKRFETTSTGCAVTGGLTISGDLTFSGSNIIFGDSSDGASDDVLKFGAGTDLSIYSNGSEGILGIPDGGTLKIKDGSNTMATFSGASNQLDIGVHTVFIGASSNAAWDKANNRFAGTITEINVTANNSTDETCYPLFADGATGSQGAESDTGLTYNPSTGLITTTGFVGSIQTAAQTNITSLGTLTGLTVNGDLTLTGAAANIVFDKSDNALEFADSAKAVFGTGSDLEIYHSGANKIVSNNSMTMYIGADQTQITNAGITEACAKFIADGAVELYWDNLKRFETTSAGCKLTGNLENTGKVLIGTSTAAPYSTRKLTVGDTTFGDTAVEIRSSSTTTGRIYFTDSSTSGEGAYQGEIKFDHGAESANVNKFSFNIGNSTKFSLDSSTATFAGDVNLADSKKIKLGASNDLSIYHGGTDSVINNDTGDLYVQSDDQLILKSVGTTEIRKHTGDVLMFKAVPDGAVELYHSGDAKLATSATGVTVTGAVTATSFSGDGSSLTGVGGGNSVDLVANGAIAAGKPVIIRTDGKAEQIKTAGVAINPPSNYSSGYDLDSSFTPSSLAIVQNLQYPDYGVAVYANTSANIRMKSVNFVTGSTSGGVLNMGSGNGVNSTGKLAGCIYCPTRNMFVIAHVGSWTSKGGAQSQFITVKAVEDATDLNFQANTETNCSNKNFYDIEYVGNAQFFIVCNTSSGLQLFGPHLINSNGTITVRNSVLTVDSNDAHLARIKFNSDYTKFVIAYTRNSNKYIYARYGTWNGSAYAASMSLGSETAVSSAATGGNDWQTGMDLCCEKTSEKWVLALQTSNTSRARCLTVSGTSISAGTEVQIDSGNPDGHFRVVDNNTVDGAVTWMGLYQHGAGIANLVISGTNGIASVTTGQITNNGPDAGYSNIGMCEMKTAFSNYTNPGVMMNWRRTGSKFMTYKARNASAGTNITTSSHNNVLYSTNVLGFAEDAISNGSTGTIKLPGNVVGNQSGLSAGSFYYYQADGTLGTSEDNSIQNLKAGVAISSSKLVVGDPNRL